ncbi:MAG: AAA family ATPase [Kiloniellaceae bacterium]
MRIKSISTADTLPIKNFQVENLSDVAVLAGPNGVGKSRLINSIIGHLRKPQPNTQVKLVIEATVRDEWTVWDKRELDTQIAEDCQLLQVTFQSSRRRRNWKSSVLNFESNRTIQKVKPFTFSWDISEPDEDNLGWDFTFAGLQNRWQDTLHSLLRKVEARRKKIADRAEKLMSQGQQKMDLNFPDPLEAYKDAFAQLLAPKQLLDAEAKHQDIFFQEGTLRHPIGALSSGEREVVNIVFDFLLRNPSDCVVFFDEPELHLHPELSYKLIQTLRSVGERNQFIFCTHSPDIITASLENTVVFVSPQRPDGGNQAVVVSDDDHTEAALKLLGQSIGIISLGRRIVLIEGTNSSLDKQTYGSILRGKFPDLVLVPSEGKELIGSFSEIHSKILSKTLWGIEFYMLCDRDALPTTTVADQPSGTDSRLRTLSRYHLENYFLDHAVWSKVLGYMEAENSWLCQPNRIEELLRQFAKETLSYATSLVVSAKIRLAVGNVDLMPKSCHEKSLDELLILFQQRFEEEQKRVGVAMDKDALLELARETYRDLEASISNGDAWKVSIPGRPILRKLAGKVRIDTGRLKVMYIKEAEQCSMSPFDEIISIFSSFNDRS